MVIQSWMSRLKLSMFKYKWHKQNEQIHDANRPIPRVKNGSDLYNYWSSISPLGIQIMSKKIWDQNCTSNHLIQKEVVKMIPKPDVKKFFPIYPSLIKLLLKSEKILKIKFQCFWKCTGLISKKRKGMN